MNRGTYVTDIDALNRVLLAAEQVCHQPDKHNLDRLRQEIDRAKFPGTGK